MNILKSELLNQFDWLSHGFFDRTEGYSSKDYDSLNVGINRGDDDNLVLKNRTKITEQFDTDISNMIILNQTHSNIVHVIDQDNIEQYKFKSVDQALGNKGDAIITKESGLLIGVNTADCAPILLCDTETKYIAVIHAGWRGIVRDIIENTVSKLSQLGCKNLISVIGPCIQFDSFEVNKDDIPHQYHNFVKLYKNSWHFDMAKLAMQKLLVSGVNKVIKLPINTFTDENYFSYRRSNGKTGVQFSGIIKR